MTTAQIMISLIFVVGYIMLVFEHSLKVNKAAIALLTGVLSWGAFIQLDHGTFAEKMALLSVNLADISQVLFFLIGAMTIVELIASYRGFDYLNGALAIAYPGKLFWMLLLIGFFLSSILDNLTTILVLITLLRNTVADKQTRRLMAAAMVFAVNVGGAWTPIGDITTTMLWISGNVNTVPLISRLFAPSILSLLFFGTLFSMMIPKEPLTLHQTNAAAAIPGKKRVLFLGTLSLVMVPILKMTLDMPPFMGMMASLAVLWVVTDRLNNKYEAHETPTVDFILTKIDISCVMFFLGILLSIYALESAGVLNSLAALSTQYISNPYLFSLAVGLLSAVVDNVPLVAASIHMFDPSVYPSDSVFWHLLAYCAGVGGSVLIIGSAPGVALMSLEEIRFSWYLKKIAPISLAAFLFGWGLIYLLS